MAAPPATARGGTSGRLPVLELFCGIGGCAQALAGAPAQVVGALDINHRALEVYRNNFPHPTEVRTLESVAAEGLRRYRAQLWWLSPPCQPFTRRGRRRDDLDPRSRALLHLIGLVEKARPAYLALENVPGFRGSRTHGLLLRTLIRAGYHVHEELLCPSELGVPNRRRRYYLLAGRQALVAPPAAATGRRSLSSYLEAEPAADLLLDPEIARRYRGALHLVDAGSRDAVTTCFTSAYGRSPVRSGSFLHTRRGPRRFSPREVLRLLGFPDRFRLPPGLPRDLAWRLAGNSLSLLPVRRLLARVPELSGSLFPAPPTGGSEEPLVC